MLKLAFPAALDHNFPPQLEEKTSPSPENGDSMFLVRKTAIKYFYLTNIIVYNNYQLILSHGCMHKILFVLSA